MIRIRMKNRFKILIAFLAIVLSLLSYLSWWFYKEISPRYLEALEDSLVETSTLLSSMVEVELKDENLETLNFQKTFEKSSSKAFNAFIRGYKKDRFDLVVYITDNKGLLIFDSSKKAPPGQDFSQWNDIHLTLQGKYGARATRSDPLDSMTSILYVASPILSKNNKIIGVLSVGKPTESIKHFIYRAQLKIIILFISFFILVIVSAYLFSNWVDKIQFEKQSYIERFVQGLTHEVKSPLSAIKGASELLQENRLNEDQKKALLENISLESNRIHLLLDRLLKLASIQSESYRFENENIELDKLIKEIVTSLNAQAQLKNLTIKLEGETQTSIQGDSLLLRQAISNLFQNAIDFSNQNSTITVHLSYNKSPVLEIIDEGSGIPSYAEEKIFDRFYSLQRPQGAPKSTGLGLNFAREVFQKHKAKLEVKNNPNKGVTARVIF